MSELNTIARRLALVIGLLLFVPFGLVFGDELNRGNFADSSLIVLGDLAEMRAGNFNTTTTVQSIQKLKASVIGGNFNAGSIKNGDIVIRDNAFDNFGGIGLVVGNTGNNVAIDAGLAVTINLQ